MQITFQTPDTLSSSQKPREPNKKKRREKLSKRLVLSPLSPKHSRSSAVEVVSGLDRAQVARPKLKKKKEIRQKFLRNVLETRSSSTFLIRAILRPTSPSPLLFHSSLHLSTDSWFTDDRRTALRKLEHVHRVNRGPRRSTPWVINRRNSDRKQRGIH